MYSWIRTEREARGLSQAKLSQLTGLTQVKLSAWEHKKSAPSESEERKIRAALAKFDALNSVERKQLLNGKIKWSRDYETQRVGTTARRDITAEQVAEFAARANHSRTGSQKFNPARMATTPLRAVALFAGCGGMALGFQESGIEVVGHVELNDAARGVFEYNFVRSQRIGSDITKVSNATLREFAREVGDVEVIFGGPPCQGFSLTGKRDVYDPRNQLYKEFARFVQLLKPRFFVLENVRLLTSMKTPDGSLLIDDLVQTFESLGYSVRYQVLNAMDFGVPQCRDRLFVVGVLRDGKKNNVFDFPRASHGTSYERLDMFRGSNIQPFRTLRDAVGDLERLESGEASESDPLHFAVAHPSHVIAMLKDVPEGCSAHENPNPALRPKSGYNTTYKRLRWDEPSSTISTTFGMISGSRNVHPRETRSLTIREALRCQSFPDDFVVFGSLGDIRTMIGNAVPPGLGAALAGAARMIIEDGVPSRGKLAKISGL